MVNQRLFLILIQFLIELSIQIGNEGNRRKPRLRGNVASSGSRIRPFNPHFPSPSPSPSLISSNPILGGGNNGGLRIPPPIQVDSINRQDMIPATMTTNINANIVTPSNLSPLNVINVANGNGGLVTGPIGNFHPFIANAIDSPPVPLIAAIVATTTTIVTTVTSTLLLTSSYTKIIATTTTAIPSGMFIIQQLTMQIIMDQGMLPLMSMMTQWGWTSYDPTITTQIVTVPCPWSSTTLISTFVSTSTTTRHSISFSFPISFTFTTTSTEEGGTTTTTTTTEMESTFTTTESTIDSTTTESTSETIESTTTTTEMESTTTTSSSKKLFSN